MACGSTPHFVTAKGGVFKPSSFFMPDAEYGRALDCLVKATTDILLRDAQRHVLLAKRNLEPQPDWWMFGGRMIPGRSVRENVAKILERDIGVNVRDLDDIRTVGHYSFVWDTREQEPIGNGTCDISVVTTVQVDRDSIGELDKAEYDDIKWVDIDEVIDNPCFHPALRRSCADLLVLQAHDELLASGADDDALTAAARVYAAAVRRAAAIGSQVTDTAKVVERSSPVLL